MSWPHTSRTPLLAPWLTCLTHPRNPFTG
ncbi:hypothetical protein QR98_0022400, partial [Sarcoptes scabiei]